MNYDGAASLRPRTDRPFGSIGVVGGGLVGLATARHLQRLFPGTQIVLWEKEAGVGRHQSSHNSGVLHAGLYYKPGSLKARLAVSGIRRMVAFCQQQGIPHEICGKLVVATDETEVARLRALLERGAQNGLRGLRWVSREELREIEPHAAGVAAVHVPEEGIVDFGAVCAALQREFESGGGLLVLSARVVALRQSGGRWDVATTAGDRTVDFLVNCAGLHCDRLARLAGVREVTRIVPFRGEYYRLGENAARLVRHLIYPVPDPTFPFLGVHFTRLIGGGVEAGPNAVLALSREGYSWAQVSIPDLLDALSYPGLWRFMHRHTAMTWDEVSRSLSRRRFCAALQKLVPEVRASDLMPGGAGVRAQALLADGTLVQDFHFAHAPGALHVLNAPSPGATASLAIGEHIAGLVGGRG
ncbi:MAG TPA: L-2-hydroxyglutarate oxidase [Phycisphaerae bacterium]|nr:L-2-hydroxyglutarate oxidase [Phycisphaerae bacterium]